MFDVINFCLFYSYFLWSISKPGKNGRPLNNLSSDSEAAVSNEKYTTVQLAHERVITKIFAHYKIPMEITDTIRTTFKSKLHRMGKTLSMTGGKKRSQLLNEWRSSVWEFKVSKVELNNLFKTRKRRFEEQINQETLKRQKLETAIPQLIEERSKLEKEVITLKDTNKHLSEVITESNKKVHSSLKPWNDCSRQWKLSRKKT